MAEKTVRIDFLNIWSDSFTVISKVHLSKTDAIEILCFSNSNFKYDKR